MDNGNSNSKQDNLNSAANEQVKSKSCFNNNLPPKIYMITMTQVQVQMLRTSSLFYWTKHSLFKTYLARKT